MATQASSSAAGLASVGSWWTGVVSLRPAINLAGADSETCSRRLARLQEDGLCDPTKRPQSDLSRPVPVRSRCADLRQEPG